MENLPPIDAYEPRGTQSKKAEPEQRYRTLIEANHALRSGLLGIGFEMECNYCDPPIYIVRQNGQVAGIGMTPDFAIADAESNMCSERGLTHHGEKKRKRRTT